MSNFAILVESSCDLSADLRRQYKIDDYLRGILYYPDGKSVESTLDWEQFSPEAYYGSMKAKDFFYKTAYPSSADFEGVFERYLAEGRDVLFISLSSGLSGCYNASLVIAKKLSEKYPERKILCHDSRRYSTAIGMQAIKAAKLRDEGKSIEETFEYLCEYRYRVHQMGTMDDLFFLAKMGRISNAKAFFGTMVGVKTLAEFTRQGAPGVLGKCKGQRAAFDVCIDYIEQTIEHPEEQTIFIAHSIREDAANEYARRINERFHPSNIIINPVGTSCGATIGPGLCAAFYEGVPVSEDYSTETALMNKILEDNKKK